MTIKRAIKLKSYATKEKCNKVNALIRRYRSQVNSFIDHIWLNRETAKLDAATLASVDKVQDLSERYKSNALKQALQICKSTRSKSKPKFTGYPILDAKFVSIEQNKKAKQFDLWLRLSTLKTRHKISIPNKKHKHLNKWLENGKLIQGCELRPDGFIVWVESEPVESKSGLKIGIDVGMHKLITTSYGAKLGTDFNRINDKILRKKKNSKSYKRAIKEKKNYINQSVNQLPWGNLEVICYENLKNLKSGKRKRNKNLRQKQQYWSYRQVIESVKMKAQANRVRLVYVNPAYTSQKCSACGNIAESSRNLEEYKCVACGHTQDADVNAAQNILHKGLDWIASLESARSKSVIS